MADPAAAGRPVLGVSVCVWKDDQVLMIQRGRPPSMGLWAPVGGRVEPGELLAAAAEREVMEEAGIACAILGLTELREIIQHDPDGRLEHHFVLAVHAARWLSGAPVAGDDAAAARWVDPDRLTDLPLVEGVVPYILASRRLIDAGAG